MAQLTHLMIHCLDTPAHMHIDKKDIEQWHLVERGWSRVGYSAFWQLDGTLIIMIEHDGDDNIDPWEISNGARGWNGVARHVGYAGGAKGKDTRTHGQLVGMQNYVQMTLMLWPDIKLIGHNQVNEAKYCPSFDVPKWARMIGVPEKNIDSKIYY